MTRITASFVRPPRLLTWVLAAIWFCAAALVVAAGWIALDWSSMRGALPALVSELPSLEARHKKAEQESRSAPNDAQLSALLADIAVLNKTSLIRGWSTSQLLVWLAAHMPTDVYLVSLHHKASDGEALLVAEAANAAALTNFLSTLERETNFSEVLLSKQATHGDGAEQLVQFEIKLRLKS